MKQLFLRLEPSIYAIFILCSCFIAGAVIIQVMPGDYAAIHTLPLFQWLDENRRPDTFWLYVSIALFAFLSVTSTICLVKDVGRKKVFTAIFHMTFILVALSHLVNSVAGFRILGRHVEPGRTYRMTLPEPLDPFILRVENLDFKMSPYGMPHGINAVIIYSFRGSGAAEKIAVNEPVQIGDVHVILKGIASTLKSVNLSLNDGRSVRQLTLKADAPFTGDSYHINILDTNDDLSVVRIAVEDVNGKTVQTLYTGSTIQLGRQSFRVEQAALERGPAAVLDFTYDPSLYLMFYASSVFSIFLVAQALKRFILRR